MSLMSRAIRDI